MLKCHTSFVNENKFLHIRSCFWYTVCPHSCESTCPFFDKNKNFVSQSCVSSEQHQIWFEKRLQNFMTGSHKATS